MNKETVLDFTKRASEQLDSLTSEKVIILTGARQKKFVVMSIQHYHSLVETLHLLSTPANANRLMDSIKEHKDSAKDNRQAKNTKESHSQDSSDSRILKLNKKDSEILMNALNNPPEPSERLRSKMKSKIQK
jgi:antitoxin YefM